MYRTGRWELTRARLNLLLAGLAGGLFFAGWWIMIDVNTMHKKLIDDNKVYHLPGIIATISLIATNIIPMSYLYSDGLRYSDGCCAPWSARLYLFILLVIAFGMVTSACYIVLNDFLLVKKKDPCPGIGIWFQNAFIFAANMILRFGIWEETM